MVKDQHKRERSYRNEQIDKVKSKLVNIFINHIYSYDTVVWKWCEKLNSGYLYDTYHTKEANYHYLFPIPFINYFMIKCINYKVDERESEGVSFSVIFDKHYEGCIRKYLEDVVVSV